MSQFINQCKLEHRRLLLYLLVCIGNVILDNQPVGKIQYNRATMTLEGSRDYYWVPFLLGKSQKPGSLFRLVSFDGPLSRLVDTQPDPTSDTRYLLARQCL